MQNVNGNWETTFCSTIQQNTFVKFGKCIHIFNEATNDLTK